MQNLVGVTSEGSGDTKNRHGAKFKGGTTWLNYILKHTKSDTVHLKWQ